MKINSIYYRNGKTNVHYKENKGETLEGTT